MAKWFTADLHLDHQKLLDLSPRGVQYPNVDDWNNDIIATINNLVHKGDFLFILGDFTFKRLAYWRQKIRHGQVWLIRGNHDPAVARCKEVFGNCYRETFMTKVCGTPCWLSHYPHAYWPMSHRGSIHLYGHCHTNQEENLDNIWAKRKSGDVGIDNAYRIFGDYRPFSEDEIMGLWGIRPGHDPVDFYKRFNRSKDG